MSRFLNLPQRSEVPDELVEQFFGTKSNAAKMEAAAQSRNEQEREEMEQKQSALPPASSSSASTSPNQRQKISFQPSSASFVPSAASSGGSVLSKGTGPLGPLLGFGQLGLGLGLLCLDALTNPLSQSWFAVSASLCAILCALLSFISASRWPDRTSLWLLLPFCAFTAILWACLCAECAHQLVMIQRDDEGSGTYWDDYNEQPVVSKDKCQSLSSSFGWSWLEKERQEELRPCLSPILNSMLLCAALIGMFLSLCSLLLCCRFLRPRPTTTTAAGRMGTPLPMIAAARRPFSLLVSPAGTRRPRPIQLPLLKVNGQANLPMQQLNSHSNGDGIENEEEKIRKMVEESQSTEMATIRSK